MRLDRVKFVTELTKQDLTLKELANLSGVNRVTLSNTNVASLVEKILLVK